MFLALVIMVTLSGCGVTRYDTEESIKAIMPSLVQYDKEIQDKALQEAQSGVCEAHIEFAKDYIQLRDKIRVIEKEL